MVPACHPANRSGGHGAAAQCASWTWFEQFMTTRRHLLSSVAGFCVYALLSELRAATPSSISSVSARRWIDRQGELARGLASGTVSQVQWHDAVNALASEIDLEALASEVRRAEIRIAGVPFGHDPQKRFVTFLDEQGEPMRVDYGVALFDFSPDSVITPHAHKNMASAHMVLEGRVRIRTFDRVKDEEGALIVRPTTDEIADPGRSSAMTSAKDNVHWFTPHAGRAMTLDVIIDGLEPGQDRYVIQPLDPLGGTHLPDGTIRAPLLTFERSMEIYTSSM